LNGHGADARGLVLAGERGGPDRLRSQEGVESKADIRIGDRPMLDHVLAALAGASLPPPCYLVGAHPATMDRLKAEEGAARVSFLAGGPGPAASLLAAMDAIGQVPLLVTTSDHPLLTTDIIKAFLAGARASGADLAVGLAVRETVEVAFPGVSRTYFPLGKHHVSGCNLFFIASPQARLAVQFWAQAEADRKRPLRLAARFGPLTALRMLRPGIAMADIFALLSGRLGCRVEPVLLAQGEAAVDVDKPEDLALVRNRFQHAGRGVDGSASIG